MGERFSIRVAKMQTDLDNAAAALKQCEEERNDAYEALNDLHTHTALANERANEADLACQKELEEARRLMLAYAGQSRMEHDRADVAEAKCERLEAIAREFKGRFHGNDETTTAADSRQLVRRRGGEHNEVEFNLAQIEHKIDTLLSTPKTEGER